MRVRESITRENIYHQTEDDGPQFPRSNLEQTKDSRKGGHSKNKSSNVQNTQDSPIRREEEKVHGRSESKDMSVVSGTTFGYTFKLPKFNATEYIEFIDALIFGNKRRDAIMNPIPPSAG